MRYCGQFCCWLEHVNPLRALHTVLYTLSTALVIKIYCTKIILGTIQAGTIHTYVLSVFQIFSFPVCLFRKNSSIKIAQDPPPPPPTPAGLLSRGVGRGGGGTGQRSAGAVPLCRPPPGRVFKPGQGVRNFSRLCSLYSVS
jgi:hypothetical protein